MGGRGVAGRSGDLCRHRPAGIRRHPICRWFAPRLNLNPCLYRRRLHVPPRMPSAAGSSHRRSWTSRSCRLRAGWRPGHRIRGGIRRQASHSARWFSLCMTCATMMISVGAARRVLGPRNRRGIHKGAMARSHPVAGDSRSGSSLRVPASRLMSGRHPDCGSELAPALERWLCRPTACRSTSESGTASIETRH